VATTPITTVKAIRQWTEAYTPEEDVVRIAWQVVVAALNDLAALPTRP
jgi:hypothetical protein